MPQSPLRIFEKGRRATPLAMISVYDAPAALLCCEAGADALLVGDSLGNVLLGHDDFISVDIEDMARHTAAVVRGAAKSPRDLPVVADMPFGSYHGGRGEIVANATRLMRAGAHALKLEGANAASLRAIELCTQMGAPVMGHLGFTPQSSLKFSSTVQGKSAPDADRILVDALRLHEAGCFAVVLEAMTSEVAAHITQKLPLTTIGIGAGAACDGQVLIFHDLAGLLPGDAYRFVKRFANTRATLLGAARAYVEEVHGKTFPTAENGWAMGEVERGKWHEE